MESHLLTFGVFMNRLTKVRPLQLKTALSRLIALNQRFPHVACDHQAVDARADPQHADVEFLVDWLLLQSDRGCNRKRHGSGITEPIKRLEIVVDW